MPTLPSREKIAEANRLLIRDLNRAHEDFHQDPRRLSAQEGERLAARLKWQEARQAAHDRYKQNLYGGLLATPSVRSAGNGRSTDSQRVASRGTDRAHQSQEERP